ncbi:MAG TPA: hypothetical protein VJ933_08125 [Phaeodactylibacter sp.]|nr:hypothetical protein [Phaeodactylibacter sp.]
MKPITALLVSLALFVGLFGCAADSDSAAPGSSTGVGGSLARFTILGDFLYTVDNTRLVTFDISDPLAPEQVSAINVTLGVETIFPLKDHLLLGTQRGMFIYRVGPDGQPLYVSNYQHVVSCDPVVANDTFAYVTLRVSECRDAGVGAANTLDVIDIRNIESPQLVNQLPMDGPYGLGLDGELLFVCLGVNGLQVFTLEDPSTPVELKRFEGINAVDVIPLEGTLLVVGPEALLQLDYSDMDDIKVISEMSIGS